MATNRMAINHTKLPSNIPNDLKLYQNFSRQGYPKFTQIGIFGIKNVRSGKPGTDSKCIRSSLQMHAQQLWYADRLL
jgi:hypothetical protein